MVPAGQSHVGSPRELMERLNAERRGSPFLTYRDGAGAQRLVDLEAVSDRLSVGRHSASDLALPWDGEASRLHAELERIAGRWTVVDDGRSRNGTYVNEERIHGRTVLADGDIVRVGQTCLAFRAPAQSDGSATHPARRQPAEVSPAQRRVLVALCRPVAGTSSFASPASNRQIADELVIGIETVRTHIRALFAVLDIGPAAQNEKRAALARAAIERGVITPRDYEPAREGRLSSGQGTAT